MVYESIWELGNIVIISYIFDKVSPTFLKIKAIFMQFHNKSLYTFYILFVIFRLYIFYVFYIWVIWYTLNHFISIIFHYRFCRLYFKRSFNCKILDIVLTRVIITFSSANDSPRCKNVFLKKFVYVVTHLYI